MRIGQSNRVEFLARSLSRPILTGGQRRDASLVDVEADRAGKFRGKTQRHRQTDIAQADDCNPLAHARKSMFGVPVPDHRKADRVFSVRIGAGGIESVKPRAVVN